MATPAVTDVVPGQLEVVERELQMLFEESDQLAARVRKSSKVQQVSRYLYRIPYMLYRGGAFRKYGANNATLGAGTGMVLGNLTAGYITSIRAYRVTREQQNTTSTKKQSIIDVLAETLAHAMEDAMIDDDLAFHTDGTGVLTNASSAYTTTTQTFAGATDTLGVNRLREGMVVDVWKSSLQAGENLSSALTNVQITAIDWTAKKVTLDQAVTGADGQANVLTFPGLTVFGPTAPTSFSSTWPDKTVAGGIGGDSFRHGFLYSHDITTSNYFLGKLKSSVPQLIPARVNASGGGITFDHGQLGIDQLIQRRNITSGNQLLGVFHMAQRSAVQKLGVTIANKYLTGTDFGKSMDLLPANHGYTDTFEFCGIPCILSKRQDRARADFLNLSKWGRAELHPIRFFDYDGKKMFEGRGSDGTVQSFVEFFIEASYDFVAYDPGADLYIDNLQVPTGY